MVLLEAEDIGAVTIFTPIFVAGVSLGTFGSSRLTCVSLTKEGDDLASGLSAVKGLAGSWRGSMTEGAEVQPVNNSVSGRA